jgi:hypothetical protein
MMGMMTAGDDEDDGDDHDDDDTDDADAPEQALESVMVEHMKPWQPLDVMDVRFNPATEHVELRW